MKNYITTSWHILYNSLILCLPTYCSYNHSGGNLYADGAQWFGVGKSIKTLYFNSPCPPIHPISGRAVNDKRINGGMMTIWYVMCGNSPITMFRFSQGKTSALFLEATKNQNVSLKPQNIQYILIYYLLMNIIFIYSSFVFVCQFSNWNFTIFNMEIHNPSTIFALQHKKNHSFPNGKILVQLIPAISILFNTSMNECINWRIFLLSRKKRNIWIYDFLTVFSILSYHISWYFHHVIKLNP